MNYKDLKKEMMIQTNRKKFKNRYKLKIQTLILILLLLKKILNLSIPFR
jgi:hypothetical protein